MTDNTISKPIGQSLVKTLYFIHLLIALGYSIFLIAKYNEIISTTITFSMIVIYGFMAVWLLIISFVLIVAVIILRYAKNIREQCVLLVYL
jgi:hypothetical protein